MKLQFRNAGSAGEVGSGFDELRLWQDGDHVGVIAVALSTMISVLVVVAFQISLPVAVGLVVIVAGCAFVARRGLLGIAMLLVGVLPWLVVLTDILPKLTETFTAGATMAVLLLVAAPRHDGSKISTRLRIGMVLFFTPVIIGLARDPGGAQFIQAAKYLVFPFTVLAVTEGTNRPALARLSMVALVSGAAATTLNLALGSTGLNHSYYGAGDIDGLGSEHDISLLAGAVTAASLGMAGVVRWAPVSAVGTMATIATGVRSTLPGILLAVLARMLQAGARARTVVVVALVALAVLATGLDKVLVARFTHSEQVGEFQSLASFGSGRGEIYATAIHDWWKSTPIDWVVGTGLRSIPAFERESLGQAFVGHSDVIEVGVQIGLIGLFGLVLIWSTLIARAESKLPLLVLATFALFNGALEYGAPLVVTLLLTVNKEQGETELHRAEPARERLAVGPRWLAGDEITL